MYCIYSMYVCMLTVDNEKWRFFEYAFVFSGKKTLDDDDYDDARKYVQYSTV